MIEPAFWSLAKQSILDARKSASERTKKALEGAKKDGEHSMAEGSGGKEDDTPVATAEQLVGMECVRFQGLRVGYFTVDKDSVLACLDEPEGKEPGWREGDKLVLNRIVSLKEDTTKKTVG
jgi:glutaminyl-tRNA synthetase